MTRERVMGNQHLGTRGIMYGAASRPPIQTMAGSLLPLGAVTVGIMMCLSISGSYEKRGMA